jgi:5-methyltetrahydropteroyltriglutamate--homocysteine methyltransferase
MAPRTAPPFRADHVGSLLRPPALLRARAGRAAGTITADQLTQAEDRAVRTVPAPQVTPATISARRRTVRNDHG